jgi:hypothetical protein
LAAAAALPTSLVLLLMAVVAAPVEGAVLPEADLQLVGSLTEAPPGGGITTRDTMEYDLTIRNLGPTEIPARRLLLVLFVERSGGSEPWSMEVARFDADDLRPPPGGSCGVGRHEFIQCTNSQRLPPGGEIRVRIGHRHPEAVAGALTFVAEVDFGQTTIVDPVRANNAYRGPSYGFVNPPTTTSSSTTSTTSSSTTSTTMMGTTDPSTTTETTAGSTTASSATTSSSTTAASPTTTASSTTSTTAPTTTSTSSSSIEPLTGSATLLTTPSRTEQTQATVDQQLVLGPSTDDPGDGPPYLLLGALAALVLVVGGAGVAAYAHLNRPPPLVDIRNFD